MRSGLPFAIVPLLLIALLASPPAGSAEEVLFEDAFDRELSDKWQIVGLEPDDYRVRDGALELRVTSRKPKQPRPMLKVDLPFTTADAVVASVDVTAVDGRLSRGHAAGLCLTDSVGVAFSGRKTNIDGYVVLAPGAPEFIGEPGQEGDPDKYTVKYWPADEEYGPLRVLIRGHYGHFQVGPSSKGDYKTFFHSALRKADAGLGFGLFATGGSEAGERWVRFDNFRVVRH